MAAQSNGLEETLPFDEKILSAFGLNKVKEPFLGTMGKLAGIFLSMEQIQANASPRNVLYEGDVLVKKNHKLACRAISVAILNGPLKIFFLSRILSFYLRWNIQPSQLNEAIGSVRLVMNIPDYISSIRLMAGVKRTTQPNNVETANGY